MAGKNPVLSEAVYRAVVEGSPVAKVMINHEGEIVLVNAQAEKLFGYRRNELIGRKVDMLVPDGKRSSHPKLRGSFFSDPKTRKMGAGGKLNGRRKDGSEFAVEIGLNPIKTAEGEFVLAV